MVNFYCDLYPKQAEILAPLTTLCGQSKKFHWTDEHKTAFKKVKDQMAQETMLTYPQFEKPFTVYTDTSNKQTGGAIMQDNKPLGFFSQKLTNTQRRYPVTEQQLLAITETLKYYKHMLCGHEIVVKTDHKILLTTNRLMPQILFCINTSCSKNMEWSCNTLRVRKMWLGMPSLVYQLKRCLPLTKKRISP
jgi:hypothetical protein